MIQSTFMPLVATIRICPALTITEVEINEILGRLEVAIERSVAGSPRDLDFSTLSSLAVRYPIATDSD
ncbi:hypothetical protein N9F34_01045 [Alphaproteobacteria bacterium]|nr:hypothetical protein [Alphaproteobacteria bacterium]